MINKQIALQGVPKKELDALENALAAILENIQYYKDAGTRRDQGGPKYPYAFMELEYGIKDVLRSPTPAVWVDAKGQSKEGPFALNLRMAIPEDLYERISSALDGAPTIQAGLGQAYAGK